MTESNLTRYEKDGIEILINTETGESFASVSGYARMANKDKSTISRRFSKVQTVAQTAFQTANILTATGSKTVGLITEDLIAKWLPSDNPESASQLLRLGVRGFLHSVAGYKITSSAIAVNNFDIPQTYIEALEAHLRDQKRIALLEAEKEANKPKVLFAESIEATEDSISIGNFAKSIGVGRNRLFAKLRQISILQQNSTIPYQRYIDSEYFVVSEINKNDRLFVYAQLTPRGQIWLTNKLLKIGYLERCPKMVLSEKN